jgi:hypothetical protein
MQSLILTASGYAVRTDWTRLRERWREIDVKRAVSPRLDKEEHGDVKGVEERMWRHVASL